MSVALRVLDDGAWISVNDERRVSVSELWRVDGVCPCQLADFVVEGFVDVGVGVTADPSTVAARTYGQCIQCGTSTTSWLPVGRVRDGQFRPYDPGYVRRPTAVEAADH